MKPSSRNDLPDFMTLYERYHKSISNGARAELRRIAQPDQLVEAPSFYRLTVGFGSDERIQRLVFCLPYIRHIANGKKLGHALAEAKVSEKRLFMVIRSQPPNDLIQLRRLLQQAEPAVDWQDAAKQLYYWNDLSKRTLLEDYFLHLNESTKSVTA